MKTKSLAKLANAQAQAEIETRLRFNIKDSWWAYWAKHPEPVPIPKRKKK